MARDTKGLLNVMLRRPRAGSHRWKFTHWVIYILFAFTIIETYTRLSGNPGLLSIDRFQPVNRPSILRPGQYQEINNLPASLSSSPLLYPLVNGEENEGFDKVDSMGFLHDRRNGQFYFGGLSSLTSSPALELTHPEPSIYDPYPLYNTREWRKQYHGDFAPCLGPRGQNLDRTRKEDMMLVYKGKQAGFPAPAFGSYEALGLDGDVCTDRYSRFGAYGYDEDSNEEVPGFERPRRVNWQSVDWHRLQEVCLERNANRYSPGTITNTTLERPLSFNPSELPKRSTDDSAGTRSRRYQSRSALLVRTWSNMKWTRNHREYLRALIMELSLHSGGEYEVFLLVHVTEDELPIFSDPKTIAELRLAIPSEFRDMALFFNNKLLEAWYPKIEEHAPVMQHHQPLQIFSQLYPNFDFYWQLEMDGRHTGHTYHFFEKSIAFAREQPRKELWERNAYFYVPGIHGPWGEFIDSVHRSIPDPDSTVWGPLTGTGIRPMGPEPPVDRPHTDNFSWGVGEEADFIGFLPIFDPKDTTWTFPDKIWNFKFGLETPRRTAVITMGRYSRRLLDLIHHAQATRGLAVASEMTGPTWSLHHGLKAVAVPHPIYADGEWTPEELNRIYNPGPPENNNSGSETSIWNWNHLFDHIMYRLSYMFTSHTGEDLYRRWLGYRTAENEGGKSSSEFQYGRHCFPSMFLHPVKNTERQMGPDRAVP